MPFKYCSVRVFATINSNISTQTVINTNEKLNQGNTQSVIVFLPHLKTIQHLSL